MGRDPAEQATSNLFSTNTVRDASPSPTKPISAAKTFPQRYVLPKNLGHAVKHLNDEELDELFKARSMRQNGEADYQGLLRQIQHHRLVGHLTCGRKRRPQRTSPNDDRWMLLKSR
jgi:hypothetical protein